MKPTHALVDIGNVLLSFDFAPALAKLVPEGTLDAQERVESLLEKKDDFESGKIEEEAYITWSSERLGFNGSPDEFRKAWNSIFTPVEAMWSSIRELKDNGLTLILFSNTNAIHAPSLAPRYDIFSVFDHAVFSHLVGAIKPDPTIYRYAINTYDLDPAGTLYLDDLPENIATGNDFGFLTHQYDYLNHNAYLDWVQQYLAS